MSWAPSPCWRPCENSGSAAAGSTRAVRFHHVSTDEVFGTLGPGDPAFSETTPYAPHSPYAASKAASDHLVRSYGITYGLPYTITNCSNNYGPYQFPEKLIPLMILNALHGRPLPVYGDGQQIRDWLYVEDHCEAIWTVLQHGRVRRNVQYRRRQPAAKPDRGARNCARSWMSCSRPPPTCRTHQLMRFVADRPGHDRRYAMDIAKIDRELGWQPRTDVEQRACAAPCSGTWITRNGWTASAASRTTRAG